MKRIIQSIGTGNRKGFFDNNWAIPELELLMVITQNLICNITGVDHIVFTDDKEMAEKFDFMMYLKRYDYNENFWSGYKVTSLHEMSKDDVHVDNDALLVPFMFRGQFFQEVESFGLYRRLERIDYKGQNQFKFNQAFTMSVFNDFYGLREDWIELVHEVHDRTDFSLLNNHPEAPYYACHLEQRTMGEIIGDRKFFTFDQLYPDACNNEKFYHLWGGKVDWRTCAKVFHDLYEFINRCHPNRLDYYNFPMQRVRHIPDIRNGVYVESIHKLLTYIGL